MELLESLFETSRIIPMRWRSLIFDKNGISYRGKVSYSTQRECLDAMTATINKSPDRLYYDFHGLNGILPIEDYRWHMAIPELV